MKQNVWLNAFRDAFANANRQENFSYSGLEALYDYLAEYEESTGQEIELDVVALCCEYTEYENLAELQKNYTDIESFRDLENSTQVIYMGDYQDEENSFIIQDF